MPKVLWVIPCPNCGKELRVRHRRLLGRRGRCPFCRSKFLIEVPKASGYEANGLQPNRDVANMSPGGETMRFDSDVEYPLDDET